MSIDRSLLHGSWRLVQHQVQHAATCCSFPPVQRLAVSPVAQLIVSPLTRCANSLLPVTGPITISFKGRHIFFSTTCFVSTSATLSSPSTFFSVTRRTCHVPRSRDPYRYGAIPTPAVASNQIRGFNSVPSRATACAPIAMGVALPCRSARLV